MKHTQTTTCQVRHDYDLDENDLKALLREHYHIPSEAEIRWGLVTPHGPGLVFQFSWQHERTEKGGAHGDPS
jgi:hypothetical protein